MSARSLDDKFVTKVLENYNVRLFKPEIFYKGKYSFCNGMNLKLKKKDNIIKATYS